MCARAGVDVALFGDKLNYLHVHDMVSYRITLYTFCSIVCRE